MKIGYFGGSFDPVHAGHIRLAREVRRLADLDVVRLLPAGVPPHKRERRLAAPEHRRAMLEAAIRDHPELALDLRELGDEGPSYTAATMEAVAREEPGAELFFVVGLDSLAELPGWHRIDDLARLVTFLVASRPGVPAAPPAGPDHLRYRILETTPMDISSSAIRAAVAAGEAIDGMVPHAVAAYIRRTGLYRSPEARAGGAGPGAKKSDG